MRLLPSIAVVGLLATAAIVMPQAAPALAADVCGPTITDALPDQPWPLRRLRPDLVWPLTRGDGITVAVIDSGVSVTHPALDGQVLSGRDLIQSGTHGWCDESGHGTIIAGIIAGKETASSGFTGMAPNAKILPIRVLRDTKKSFDEDDPKRIAQAIVYAVDQGVQVINLSVVTPDTQDLEDAVAYAQENDVVLVAAAGNEGSTDLGDQPAYPAAYPSVLAVAGVDENGDHVDTSTSGDYVDVAAPGKEIAGPAPNGNGYGEFEEGGTSFAAAYVSGVVALARSYRQNESAAAIIERVERSAQHPAGGWNTDVGYGVVDPYWTLTSIGGAGAEVAAGGAVTVPEPADDPLSGVRTAALWIAFGGVLTALLVAVGAVVVRRGRARGWRPGRAVPPADTEPTGRKPGFAPVMGRNVSVTAPSLQRGQAAPRGGAPTIRPGKAGVSMPSVGGRPQR
ncbi:type VII secretion-associated serine protease mycosin [Actinoplanes sp. NPDC051851]|uniref:type VII secretion-associated serine protease mycosin n=1 Tax=Actinoplanes sp. NPDC051851 TaxID=3154753 RepID=UPI0034381E80